MSTQAYLDPADERPKISTLQGYNSQPSSDESTMFKQHEKDDSKQPWYSNVPPNATAGRKAWIYFARGYMTLSGWFGFTKAYTFPLWFILGGAVIGFFGFRVYYIDLNNYRPNGIPGEWYYQMAGAKRIGLLIHLIGILPGSFLAVWQFLPIIRRKAMLVHRINGYIVNTLLLLGNAGAMILARRAAGGDVALQVNFGLGVILTTLSMVMGYINIKRYQIDQHRAWMLRTWVYAAYIITLRIILLIMRDIITDINSYDTVWTCGKIDFTLGLYGIPAQARPTLFPACYNPQRQLVGANVPAVVHAANDPRNPITTGAVFDVAFGGAAWVALALHIFAVETYLRLTPKEAERLKIVSYRRQMEAGMSHPGSAGITIDRLGDAEPWVPPPEVAAEFSHRG